MSKYEQILTEIEEFIDNCKRQKLSGVNIIVNKEQLEEYISELRMKTPEEIRKYQRIINNKEAIMNDAQARAEDMLQQAREETSELISEHEIMQQAYVQAQNLVDDASAQVPFAQQQIAAEYRKEFLGEMESSFAHKFAKKPEVIKGNMAALEMAYDQVEKDMAKTNVSPVDQKATAKQMKQSA